MKTFLMISIFFNLFCIYEIGKYKQNIKIKQKLIDNWICEEKYRFKNQEFDMDASEMQGNKITCNHMVNKEG